MLFESGHKTTRGGFMPHLGVVLCPGSLTTKGHNGPRAISQIVKWVPIALSMVLCCRKEGCLHSFCVQIFALFCEGVKNRACGVYLACLL